MLCWSSRAPSESVAAKGSGPVPVQRRSEPLELCRLPWIVGGW